MPFTNFYQGKQTEMKNISSACNVCGEDKKSARNYSLKTNSNEI
jgi:hypothetical protein